MIEWSALFEEIHTIFIPVDVKTIRKTKITDIAHCVKQHNVSSYSLFFCIYIHN